jgi:hypothetical protein
MTKDVHVWEVESLVAKGIEVYALDKENTKVFCVNNMIYASYLKLQEQDNLVFWVIENKEEAKEETKEEESKENEYEPF